MTPENLPNFNFSQKFLQNLNKATQNFQEAISKFTQSQNKNAEQNEPYPLNLSEAFNTVCKNIFSTPEKSMNFIMQLNQAYMGIFANVIARSQQQESFQLYPPEEKDRRFQHEQWNQNPYYDFLVQSFTFTSKFIGKLIDETKELNQAEKHKLKFFFREIFNTIAPSNYIFSNPKVLEETIKTAGENLVNGSQNFLDDVAYYNGRFQISTVDKDAFSVGKNLAITEGDVVYQNDLMQLINYKPSTKQVYETPLILMPAWINKFYILDLQEHNSMVKWLVDQGYNVFIISWNNPDASLSHKTFENYLNEGALTAIEQVKQITEQKQVNFAGYCLGGTLLAITTAYLRSKNDNSIKSATLLTSLLDFSNAGDLEVFMDEEQIQYLEEKMRKKGYLDGNEMAVTFSLLRSNDMIWSYYINNYLLGKAPLAFDILYWNQDSTRLPAEMHSYYLRNMYKDNLLVQKKIKMNNTTIDLSKVDIPCFVFATENDHIVPWEAAYHSMVDNLQIHKDSKFVLAESGHVVGVVNPPSKTHKYGFLHDGKLSKNPNEWQKSAKEDFGSWWLYWDKWLKTQSGKLLDSKNIKRSKKSLEKAPGSYVKKQIY